MHIEVIIIISDTLLKYFLLKIIVNLVCFFTTVFFFLTRYSSFWCLKLGSRNVNLTLFFHLLILQSQSLPGLPWSQWLIERWYCCFPVPSPSSLIPGASFFVSSNSVIPPHTEYQEQTGQATWEVLEDSLLRDHARQTHTHMGQGQTRCGCLHTLQIVHFLFPTLKKTIFIFPVSEATLLQKFLIHPLWEEPPSSKFSS